MRRHCSPKGILPFCLLSCVDPRGFGLKPDRDFDLFDLESDDDFDLKSEASVRLRFLSKRSDLYFRFLSELFDCFRSDLSELKSARADGIPVGMFEPKEAPLAVDNGWLSSFSVEAVLMCRS